MIMSSPMTRKLMTFVSIVALTFWANHCVLADVHSSNEKHGHASAPLDSSSSDPIPFGHCHGNEQDHGNEQGHTENQPTSDASNSASHHAGCQEQGCCPPAIQTSHTTDATGGVVLDLTHIPIFLASLDLSSSIILPNLDRSSTSSPTHFLRTLNDLSIAANAPPA